MCLAVPGKVMTIDDSSVPRMGTVNFGGVEKQICLDWLPDARVGNYVIVHVGFAIAKLDEEDAQLTLRLQREMSEHAPSQP